jgi:hypothetical protein
MAAADRFTPQVAVPGRTLLVDVEEMGDGTRGSSDLEILVVPAGDFCETLRLVVGATACHGRPCHFVDPFLDRGARLLCAHRQNGSTRIRSASSAARSLRARR